MPTRVIPPRAGPAKVRVITAGTVGVDVEIDVTEGPGCYGGMMRAWRGSRAWSQESPRTPGVSTAGRQAVNGSLVGKDRVQCEKCSALNEVESVVRPLEGEAVADDANSNRLATVIARRLQRLQHPRMELPPFVEKGDATSVERWKEDRAVSMP
jgi:hypothetical protein